MRPFPILTALLLAAAPSVLAQTQLCNLTSLVLPQSDIPISVHDLGVYTGPRGSHGAVILVNESSTPITRIVILVDLFTADGQRTILLPLFAATREQLSVEKPPFSMPAHQDLLEPLEPGRQVGLGAPIQQSMLGCPTNAKASLVDIKFSNGRRFHYAQPEWQSQPSIVNGKALDLRNLHRTLPFEALITVSLDYKGRVTKVEGSEPDPQLRDWFKNQLSDWVFDPQLTNGEAQPSQLKLLFRIHRLSDEHDPTVFDESAFRSGPLLPVDVFPRGDITENNQSVLAGGMPVVFPGSH